MTLPRVAWPHAPGRERDVRLPKFAKVSPIGAPCHAAIAVSRMRNEDSKIRGRRVMVGSTHPAPHDARHATCGASHARIDPRVPSMRHPPTCASRRVRVSCARDVSMRMSKSHRARAGSCSSREISLALWHPRIGFSSRSRARIGVDARVGADAEPCRASTRAAHRGAHACCRKPL